MPRVALPPEPDGHEENGVPGAGDAREGRIAFRYGCAVNGSARNIAGIVNEAGNILGMMPHPERMIEPAHGGADGRRLFEGLVAALS